MGSLDAHSLADQDPLARGGEAFAYVVDPAAHEVLVQEEHGPHADLVVGVLVLVVRERRPFAPALLDEDSDAIAETASHQQCDVALRRVGDDRRDYELTQG